MFLFLKRFLVLLIFLFFSAVSYAQEINLLGSLPVHGYVYDLTGYYDETSNKEYAIVGSNTGVAIVDVTNPSSLQEVSFIEGVPGFDLKIWQNYLYCVTGSGGENLGKIVDVSNPAQPVVVSSFYSAHNIFISANGYLFAEAPGLKIYNLNNNPLQPELIWQDNLIGGHDATVIDNYVYDFHGYEGTRIYEITYKPFSMKLISTIISQQLIVYHHSGWITEDKKYLFICDEGSTYPNPDITVWDISDPANPEYVSQYGDATSLIHNLYIVDNYAYTAYYNSGFVVFDVSQPESLKVADRYDPNNTVGEGFEGSFGCYPFTRSGNIYISDKAGLFVFSFSGRTTDVDNDKKLPETFTLEQNYPNPFNPSTKINFTVAEASDVKLVVYDILGNEIETLVNEFRSPGNYCVTFHNNELTSGVYLYKLTAGNFVEVKKMILVR